MGTAVHAVADTYDRIAADGRDGIWIQLVDRAEALIAARSVDDQVRSGRAQPLAGMTFAVKNNIDVRSIRTGAACPTFGRVATHHAPVVQALVDAGAVVVGSTNMDQFATGLVGTRSPYGACPNAHWPALISGGSSSGSAVAVAAGHVDFALGTDTAGSGRVPAAANGIVGLKPTRGVLDTSNVIAACRSLDCVSIFSTDVDLAGRVLRLARSDAGHVVADREGGLHLDDLVPRRVAVPDVAALDFDGDDEGRSRFATDTTDVLDGLAADAVRVDLEPFLEAGRLLYEGAFVKERYDAVGTFIDEHPDDVDAVVRGIIQGARDLTEADLRRDRRRVAELRAATRETWDRADVLIVPSCPRVPTTDEVRVDPIGTNTMLGTYTNFVNLLDLCAITIPIGPSDPERPPSSITVIAPAHQDERLLALATRVHGHSRSR